MSFLSAVLLLEIDFDPLIGRFAFFNTAAYQLTANILPALGVRKLRSGDREFGISVCDTFVASAVQFHNIKFNPLTCQQLIVHPRGTSHRLGFCGLAVRIRYRFLIRLRDFRCLLFRFRRCAVSDTGYLEVLDVYNCFTITAGLVQQNSSIATRQNIFLGMLRFPNSSCLREVVSDPFGDPADCQFKGKLLKIFFCFCLCGFLGYGLNDHRFFA